MTLSPITVYFVLQADEIRTGLIALFSIAGGIFAVLRFLAFLRMDDAEGVHKKDAKVDFENSPSLFKAAMTGLCACLVYAFVPATKTLAASIIAPALVNSPAIQQDLPELYKLGVERLKEALGSTPKPEAK